MTIAEFQKSVHSTAVTFHDEFPGQEPELSWLAEAASVDGVPDDIRQVWFDAVTATVRGLNNPD